MTVFQRIAV